MGKISLTVFMVGVYLLKKPANKDKIAFMSRSRQARHNQERKRGENQEQVTTRGHTDILKLGCLIAIVLIIAAAAHWTSLTARTVR
jgi:hypothetical protein